MLTRRQALQTLLVAAVARPTFAAKLDRIGLQLYTVRREMAADPLAVIERVARLGFRELEFAGYHGLEPARVRRALSDFGLSAPATHVGLQDLESDADRWIELCSEVGHRYLVLAYLQPHERRELDQYRRYADLLNDVGERSAVAGIQLAYHNHDFEFVELEGEIPFDLLLGRTDPDLLKLELDLYWIEKAGASASQYFDKHPGRFPLFHVKDMDPSTGGFTEVGSGSVDFQGHFSRREQAGTQHFFVEQDVIRGDPWVSLEKSLNYLRSLSF